MSGKEKKELHEVSKILREKRKSQNLSLEEVSKKTKIHLNILKKIEESKFSEIHPTYLKGFIKIYADFLKIPSQELIEKLGLDKDKLTPPLKEKSFKVSILKKAPKIKMIKMKKIFKFVGIVAIFILMVFSLKRFYYQIKRLAHSKKLQKQKVSQKLPTKLHPTKKSKKDQLEVVIRAKRDVYLQVKVDGETVFREILIKGFSESWKAKKEVKLWIGDAGALDIEVNGKLLPRLGKNGEVLREVIITPDSIRIRR